MSNSEPADHVLLVEDNAADAEMVLRTFKQHNLANQVAWVGDGVEALDYLFHRGAYDHLTGLPKVVLLDLRLPKVDGIDVLREVRSQESMRTLPIVVLTSSKEERDIIESYNLGVNSYVSKPVAFKDFAATIANLGMYWLITNRVPNEGDAGA